MHRYCTVVDMTRADARHWGRGGKRNSWEHSRHIVHVVGGRMYVEAPSYFEAPLVCQMSMYCIGTCVLQTQFTCARQMSQ